ncbi:unnamed protein product [Albugo candida]|uniref:Uncharacterized protein n=1 Tax=Albugo candida TaxID=65357 RepID=A0A024GKT5_9STRA|nr:unnamed protein product [Albugo candida]|eukprot:CCI47155.1 unnamed protein product [Albugo candida]
MLLLWHVCKNISVDRALLKEFNMIEACISIRCVRENPASGQQVRQQVSLKSIMSDFGVESVDRQRSRIPISKDVERSCLIDRILSILNPIDSPVRDLKTFCFTLCPMKALSSLELLTTNKYTHSLKFYRKVLSTSLCALMEAFQHVTAYK